MCWVVQERYKYVDKMENNEMNKKIRLGVLTSGGDAPGMNAAIRAVVRSGIYYGAEVYGIRNGYAGLIDGKIELMKASSVSDVLHRGGTILQTARSRQFMTDEGRKYALKNLERHGIDNLVVIGGDGSLRGGMSLAGEGINVMGIPCTIDNDLPYTERTIGFDTAVNTVLSAISNVRDTSSSHERVTIIEVMGRKCGNIAMWAGIAGGAESILIPEQPVNLEEVCENVTQGRRRGKLHNLIIKAEGVELDSRQLAELICNKTGMEVRIVVPGYIQRGGCPTANDRMLASDMALYAVDLIKSGKKRMQAIGISGGKVFGQSLEKALMVKRNMNNDYIRLAKILSI